MPRPVVPIFWGPRASSRARSIAACEGRMSAAFSASFSDAGVTWTPFSRIASISRRSAQGSTTTPLPITESLPGRTTPEGSRLSRYSTFPMTSVWPALWPPWKRTTTSARSDSQSTILPLPSSPHWAPITATFAIEPGPSVHGVDSIALETVPASEPARFRGGIGNVVEPCHGHPAFSAQALGDRGAEAVGRVHEPRALLGCRRRQLERLQRTQRRGGDTCACQELAEQRRGAPADRR